jgi:hypothetical protein
MKQFFSRLFALVVIVGTFAAASFAPTASAQVYPYTNPSYIPNAIAASATLSAPGTYVFTNSGNGTVAVEIRGTCTGLAATVQGTVDGTTWTAVNIFPVTTGTITATSAVSAAGVWRTNAAGFRQMRVNVTVLSASCTFTMIGAPVGFTGTY